MPRKPDRISDDPRSQAITLATKRSVQEYLGVAESWPVVEKIGHSIILMPNKHDIDTAEKQNPMACALHNACCRSMDVPSCAIGAQYAYIPMKDKKGRPYIARMLATASTQLAIKQFDKTGKMPEGGFIFKPVPKSKQIASLRKYEKQWRLGRIGGSRPTGAKARRKAMRAIPRKFTEDEK